MSQGRALHEAIKPRRGELIESLRTIVEQESPSDDKAALDGLSRVIASRLQRLGGAVDLVPNAIGGEHVRARFGGQSGTKPALVLGHYDTVWPIGTLATMPFRVDGPKAFGPGVYDMKASLVLIEAALGAIASTGATMPRPLVVLFTSDEEIGSLRSRDLIEDEARKCEFTLVVEPPLANGALKTWRKGTGLFTLTVEGRAAHSGVEPEKGRSAVVELAHQILAIQALQRPELGTTLNVGVVTGGSATNVVPAHATARIDARVSTMAEAARLEAALKELKPVTPDVSLTLTGRIKRPPMERTPAVAALFERSRPIGKSLGLDLAEGGTGGASDGNFTAALGIPTLDGLGCPGAGAHADYEHIVIDGLLERAALLGALLLEL
jgi:glutamate carboxypeptidase